MTLLLGHAPHPVAVSVLVLLVAKTNRIRLVLLGTHIRDPIKRP
jgi:hypothetical protein